VPDSDSDSDGGADIEGDISMGGTRGEQVDDDGLIDEILTPGTLITDNPQWMR
jgi:exosome complex component RRP4